MNIQVLGMNRRPKRLHMYEYGTFIKNVLNCGPLKICILILLTLSHFCACFAFMVMDMDQNIWTDFSHHNYLTQHCVYVPFSGGGSFHISPRFQIVIVFLYSALVSQAPTCTTAAATHQ